MALQYVPTLKRKIDAGEMQKDLPEMPKRRIKRTHNITTPEVLKETNANNTTNSRASSSRHRAIVGTTDFLHSNTQRDTIPRRRVAPGHTSMLSSQISLEGSRQVAVKADNDSLLSELLYNEYLQGSAILECLGKKMKEAEKKIVTELGTISKEADYDKEKCFKLKAREVDIIQLSAATYEVDSQTADADSHIKNNKIEAFADALSRLNTYLQPLNTLQCQNIILPSTEWNEDGVKEWSEIKGILKKCFITLQSITELIGSKGEAYRDVCRGIKEFIKTRSEIEGYQKRVQKALCDLQILVLKIASISSKEHGDIIDI